MNVLTFDITKICFNAAVWLSTKNVATVWGGGVFRPAAKFDLFGGEKIPVGNHPAVAEGQNTAERLRAYMWELGVDELHYKRILRQASCRVI